MANKPKIITGHGPLITPKMTTDGYDAGTEKCIELLEEMLDSARKGDMTWMIVVAGGPNDYGSAMAGNNAAQMNLGLDIAKQSILERVKVR
jgi:hypothetical protein